MKKNTVREAFERAEEDRLSPKQVQFIEAIIKVCFEHGFTIGHEDYHGAFKIHPIINEKNQYNFQWLRKAYPGEPE